MSKHEYKTLKELLVPPISGNRPSGGVNSDTEGVPSIGGENIVLSGGMNYESLKMIPAYFYDMMPKGKLLPFDVLINKDGAQTGKVGFYNGNFKKAAINEHVFILRAKSERNLYQKYLYYAVLLPETRQKIERRITGSAQPGLNSSFVKAVTIPYQNLEKQQKIATILSTIDTAIGKTEALIAKYQQIKAGLMHDLFTRGVLPNGQLRPPREQAPELYQETAIGWIPKEWELLKVGDIVTSAEYGISESLSDHPVGIPILRMNNIKNGKFDLTDLKFGNSFDAHALTLKLGDVLYNRTNSMEHVGKAAIWHEETIKYSFASYLVRLNLDKTRVNPELFTFWFNQPSSQQALRRFATPAVQQVNINPTNVQKVNIALPSTLKEQKLAVTTLTKSDDLISSELERLLKLKSQKLGLMQDLLTGKVPVSVNEPEATHG